MLWLTAQVLRRAPRRLLLAAVAVAFPVAVLGATLLFVDQAVHSMTRVALDPVQVEMRALATSLNVDMNAVGKQLQSAPDVKRAERFASANVVVSAPGTPGQVTARLFAVDPSYLHSHPWLRSATQLGGNTLLDPGLRATPGFATATSVSIDLPRDGQEEAPPLRLSVPVGGTIDLRAAATTWFAIPTGEMKGDVAATPRALVVDYATFERSILPAFRATTSDNAAAPDGGLSDLPPVTVESHIAIDHSTYPSDPGKAHRWSGRQARILERQAPGSIVIGDNTIDPLVEAAGDATSAKVLFLLLGIPGALVAGALGVAAATALSEAHRREDALLALRGATDIQLAKLATATGLVASVVGSVVGIVAALGTTSLVAGHAVWRDIPDGRLATSLLLAIAAGLVVTAVRLVPLLRSRRRSEIVTARRSLDRGWRPRWLRRHLDLIAIAIGVFILIVNELSGGLKQTPSTGMTLGLSFYVMLAPIALWLGVTLFAVRVLLALLARRTRPESSRPLSSWPGAAFRWLGRRPARTGVALVLGALAVAFGIQVLTFTATYNVAKEADTRAAFGADLRITPGAERGGSLPPLGSKVAATSPIRFVPTRAGSDRKTIMAVDPATYQRSNTSRPRILNGRGVEGLLADPSGVVVAKEIAQDFGLVTGDTLPVTVFPDDSGISRKLNLHVVGVFRSFAPTAPTSELVMSAAGLTGILPQPDFYLGRVAPGNSPPAVAAQLRDQAGAAAPAFTVQTLSGPKGWERRNLTTLNLKGLSHIESGSAVLIAAIGIAVLGAFLIIERRREFAILRALGAKPFHVLAGPGLEGSVAAIGSLVIGIPIGLGLSAVSVRVLGLFFTLPPPLLVIPVSGVLGLVLLVVATSAISLGAALVSVLRIQPGPLLREP